MERGVIIVAGGSGSRMGGAVPKQFLPLGPEGKPVLVHTVERFLNIVAHVVVVLPASETALWEEIARRWGVKGVEVCTGGATRFASVKAGLKAIDKLFGPEPAGDCLAPRTPGSEITLPLSALRGHAVAIHDGVRPLVGRAAVERGFELAAAHGSAIPYTTPVDSFRARVRETGGAVDVNDADRSGYVGSAKTRPCDRGLLMAIQTPQIFRRDVIVDAYDRAQGDGFTDDASVVEGAGGELHFFAGDRHNIKITTPDDLLIAGALLAAGY